MSKPLLPLCSIPPVADRDGHSANSAHWLPFYGYWSASGAVYSWPQNVLAQDHSMRLGGVTMPNLYQKDCCTCAAGFDDPFIDVYRTFPRGPG